MRTSLHISLPTSLKQWVTEQVEAGGYGTESEYISELLRNEQKRKLRAQIEANLLEALESGPSEPLTAQEWNDIRREGRKLARTRQKNRA